MSAAGDSAGWLYDWALLPIGAAPPFAAQGPGTLIGSTLCLGNPPTCSEMSRVWIVPDGAKGTVPRRIADELLAALAHGMPIAILGHDVLATRAAAAAVLELAGEP